MIGADAVLWDTERMRFGLYRRHVTVAIAGQVLVAEVEDVNGDSMQSDHPLLSPCQLSELLWQFAEHQVVG